MDRQPVRPRRRFRPRGLRWRLIVAFVLVAAVSAGALAVTSYLLVRQARLEGSLTSSAVQAREDLNLAATITYPEAGGFVQAYEQRGSHAVLIFPAGRRIVSDAGVNPPIPAECEESRGEQQENASLKAIAGEPFRVPWRKRSG